ncbi:MAG: lactonase family protein [Verrucomicrobia bacterium]|nr:lactonase family protein [Verrucomicrobiota bacterium]
MKTHRLAPSRRQFFAALLLGALAAPALRAADSKECFVYYGTYTRAKNAKSKGIYVSRLDTATGKLSAPELAVEAANPGFLAVHPSGRYVYAVGELPSGGGVSAFKVDRASGKLTLLNQQDSGGAGPTHLSVDASGKALVVANYSGGSVASFSVNSDGSLKPHTSFIQHAGSSVNPARQKEPHAHCATISSDARYALVADLGMDKVMIYRLNAASATLTANEPPFAKVAPGNGPRHFAFHPEGKFAYVINEMTCTVTAFGWDSKKGALTELHTVSTLPAGVNVEKGYSTAEIFAHPNGKFLYGSNRGHDTIAVYSVAENGKLTLVQNAPAEVKVPRGFNLDPSGKWLITGGQNSDDVALFKVDAATGKLAFTGTKHEVGSPVCVMFLPVK